MEIKQYTARHLSSQFGNPRGFLGYLAGQAMAIKNRARIEWAIELLDVQQSERILEIGFGPGLAVREMSKTTTSGFIAGIDRSELMVKQASQLNRIAIAQEKVELKQGSADRPLDYLSDSFDKVLTINSHFFWENPTLSFQEVQRVLKPEGLLFIIWQPRWAKTEQEVKDSVNKTSEQLSNAGFEITELKFKPLKPVTGICVLAKKSALQHHFTRLLAEVGGKGKGEGEKLDFSFLYPLTFNL